MASFSSDEVTLLLFFILFIDINIKQNMKCLKAYWDDAPGIGMTPEYKGLISIIAIFRKLLAS